jgi:hypothetical protein
MMRDGRNRSAFLSKRHGLISPAPSRLGCRHYGDTMSGSGTLGSYTTPAACARDAVEPSWRVGRWWGCLSGPSVITVDEHCEIGAERVDMQASRPAKASPLSTRGRACVMPYASLRTLTSARDELPTLPM